MSVLTALRATSSALTAQRLRMDVISNNIANADTTRTASGTPYQRQTVVFRAGQETPRFQTLLAQSRNGQDNAVPNQGVTVSAITTDGNPGRLVYEPSHPDANADGYVEYPNVDVLTEMVDMISATRAYEANITVANALKSMAMKALEIGRG